MPILFRRKGASTMGGGGNPAGTTPVGGMHQHSESQLIVKRLGYHRNRSVEHLSRGNGSGLIGQASDKVTNDSESLRLSTVSLFNGWSNWQVRCVLGAGMISGFALLLSCGHLAIILLTVVIQTAVFGEVVNIAYVRYRERRLTWFRTLNWYFLGCTYYFLFGESLIEIFKDSIMADAFMLTLATHHRFISFCFYLVGLMIFVINLKKGHYKFQFQQFGLTHMTLLLAIVQAQFVVHNIFGGLFWFILPTSLVIANDIMAYFFGKLFGRTPLIKLSPKKTWEGFIGAFLATVLFGFFFSGVMAQFPYLTCPATDLSTNVFSDLSCPVNPLFEKQVYKIPKLLIAFLHLVLRTRIKSIRMYPVQWHSLVFAIFASLIAPFGGFFASGFKRAFKVKDFSDSIPGHGGMTDRMDCQFLMGSFVYLYHATFLKYKPMNVGAILEMAIHHLSIDDQRILYLKLQEYLIGQELLIEPGPIV